MDRALPAETVNMNSAVPTILRPGGSRNTPLGLADIRPRADSSLSDGIPQGYDSGATSQSGTSNYQAPWALYAFDWCKWPSVGNGAGKVAIGSYLEDGHNFVSTTSTYLPHTLFIGCCILTSDPSRFKFSIPS